MNTKIDAQLEQLDRSLGQPAHALASEQASIDWMWLQGAAMWQGSCDHLATHALAHAPLEFVLAIVAHIDGALAACAHVDHSDWKLGTGAGGRVLDACCCAAG